MSSMQGNLNTTHLNFSQLQYTLTALSGGTAQQSKQAKMQATDRPNKPIDRKKSKLLPQYRPYHRHHHNHDSSTGEMEKLRKWPTRKIGKVGQAINRKLKPVNRKRKPVNWKPKPVNRKLKPVNRKPKESETKTRESKTKNLES